ncbi:MAG TPA: hypothetical protein VK615_15460, partial [Candidatus Binatia bacterium]|nr:hypothetical protein [Candidatus Binatia bacterium]
MRRKKIPDLSTARFRGTCMHQCRILVSTVVSAGHQYGTAEQPDVPHQPGAEGEWGLRYDNEHGPV